MPIIPNLPTVTKPAKLTMEEREELRREAIFKPAKTKLRRLLAQINKVYAAALKEDFDDPTFQQKIRDSVAKFQTAEMPEDTCRELNPMTPTDELDDFCPTCGKPTRV